MLFVVLLAGAVAFALTRSAGAFDALAQVLDSGTVERQPGTPVGSYLIKSLVGGGPSQPRGSVHDVPLGPTFAGRYKGRDARLHQVARFGNPPGLVTRMWRRAGELDLLIELACPTRLQFQALRLPEDGAIRERWASIYAKVSVGDADLDREYAFVMVERDALRSWASEPDNRRTLDAAVPPSKAGVCCRLDVGAGWARLAVPTEAYLVTPVLWPLS